MDVSVPGSINQELRDLAETVPGVKGLEKSRVRKSGPWFFIEIHVLVDESLTVRQGHDIAHLVKRRLLGSERAIHDVVVHIEPFDPAARKAAQVKS